MNVELEKVSMWFKPNKLSLNANKTKWLLFHPLSRRQFFPQSLPVLLIENIHIKREHVTNFLRLLIDQNLFWKQHIDMVAVKSLKT